VPRKPKGAVKHEERENDVPTAAKRKALKDVGLGKEGQGGQVNQKLDRPEGKEK